MIKEMNNTKGGKESNGEVEVDQQNGAKIWHKDN